MKVLRKGLDYLIFFVLLLVMGLAGILVVDHVRTGYLRVDRVVEAVDDSYLLRNVHVVPMTSDTILMDHCVRVREGRIEAAGLDVLAGDLPLVDGGGPYLLPGLMDMHVHVKRG